MKKGTSSNTAYKITIIKIPTGHTRAVAVVIFVPPDAPVTSCTSPFPSMKMEGVIEESGRFFGSM